MLQKFKQWRRDWILRKRWRRNCELLLQDEETRNLACQLFTHTHTEYAQTVLNEISEEEHEACTDLWRITRLLTYPTNKLRAELKVLNKVLRFER